MKRNALYLFFTFIFLGVFSFQVKSQTVDISGSIEKGFVKKGTTAKGSIILLIPKELHINSNKPSTEFMITTKVKLSSKEVKISRISYPKGKDRKFEFSDEPINVYEGKTSIRFTFNTSKTLKSKTIRIRAVVSYQACTDEVCYQPAEKIIFLTAKIK